MKSRVSQALAAVLIISSQVQVSAYAFTLGELRGAAVIGRTLDVSVMVQTGEGEEANSSCMRAEVFHADAPQATPRVTVVPGRDVSNQALVRIESSATIDEPVVTVLLRATCGTSTQRKYVLLADFPVVPDSGVVASPVPVPPVMAAPALLAPTASSATASNDTAAAGQPAKPVRVAVNPKPRKKPAASVPAPAKPAAKSKAPPTAVARAPGQPVLKLDPLEVLSDRVAVADSFMDFSPAQDTLRYGQQIATLENDLKALRLQAANSEKLMLDMRTKLQQAESQGPAWLLYALAAALVASLLMLVWMWRARQADRNAQANWWDASAPETVASAQAKEPPNTQHGVVPDVPVAAVAAVAVGTATPVAEVVLPGTAASPSPVVQKVPAALLMPDASGLDIDLDLAFSAPAAFDDVASDATANVPFATHSIRHISLDPILDVRQQAEFFVSLGQTDRALLILKKLIAETAEPNPLLYLDLITLYHSLGMKADFREQRDTFHQLFNGLIPDFPAYNLPSKDLEAYPEVTSVLTRLWPRMDVLAFLSACIFHDEQRQGRQTYELAAFKDLLMLHGLADSVVDHSTPAYQDTASFQFDENGVAHLEEETNQALHTRALDLDFSMLQAEPQAVATELAPDFDLSHSPAGPGKTSR